MSAGGLLIRALEADHVSEIAAAFAAIGWNKPAAQYERYLHEQANAGGANDSESKGNGRKRLARPALPLAERCHTLRRTYRN